MRWIELDDGNNNIGRAEISKISDDAPGFSNEVDGRVGDLLFVCARQLHSSSTSMAIPSQSSSEAGPSTGPHRMRITSGGSVPAYIRFALSFLNVSLGSSARRRMLARGHTDACDVYPEHTRNTEAQDNPHRPLVLHTMPPPAPSTDPGSKNTQTTKSRGTTLHTATTSAPRLISVVEQIKREYVEQSGTKGKRPSRGIWQYTESGLLPVEPTVDDEDPLVRVLEGKTRWACPPSQDATWLACWAPRRTH